jgi:hypothetical protein
MNLLFFSSKLLPPPHLKITDERVGSIFKKGCDIHAAISQINKLVLGFSVTLTTERKGR